MPIPRLFLILVFLHSVLPAAIYAQDGSQHVDDKIIIVGGDHNYPPYEFLDENGEPAGYNVDLTRAVAEVMGIDAEIRLGNWDQVRRALQTGEIDALQGMVASEERKKDFIFAPHSIVHQAVFARNDEAKDVTSLADLQRKELIVQRGGIMHDYLMEERLDATLILVNSHADALRLLASGEGDFALVANLPSLYLGRQLGLSNIRPVGKPFPGLRYGFAVSRGNDDLLALFSQGLAILKNTGRQQEIYDRWLGPYEPLEGTKWKNVVQIGSLVLGPLIIVFAGIIFWNRSLKREVARRTREMALQQQQLIQADKMTSLGTLVSGVAHEINNPTGLILFNLPMLEKVYQAGAVSLEERFRREGDFLIGGLKYSILREESEKIFSEMLEGAARIKRIVDDLKDFARKDGSELAEDIDLNQVLMAAVRLVDNSIKKATSHFQMTCCEPLPVFKGNTQRIEQVIINLLLNACQALSSPEQGISVRTYPDEKEKGIVLEVRDEGEGIAEDQIAHLTDPFYTTKRERGGTGLGLAISAGIIEEHQGRLSFRSKLGSGTVVSIHLPVQRKE